MAEVIDTKQLLPSTWEPLRKTRWICAIEGIDSFLLKSFQRPTYTTEEVEIPFINSRRYLAGTTKFNTIAMVLYDPIVPSASQQIMEWQRLIFENVSGRSGYADFYYRDVQLKLLDPVGSVVSFWDLKSCFPTEVNFGDLDYEGNADPMMINVTLRYSQAVLQY